MKAFSVAVLRNKKLGLFIPKNKILRHTQQIKPTENYSPNPCTETSGKAFKQSEQLDGQERKTLTNSFLSYIKVIPSEIIDKAIQD